MDPYQKRKKILILFGASAIAIILMVVVSSIGGSRGQQLATYQSELLSVSYPSTYNVTRKAGSAVEFSNPNTEKGGVIRINKYAQTTEKISLSSLKETLASDAPVSEKTFNEIRMLETRPSKSSITYYLEHDGIIWFVEFDLGKDSGLSSETSQILGSLTFKDLGL